MLVTRFAFSFLKQSLFAVFVALSLLAFAFKTYAQQGHGIGDAEATTLARIILYNVNMHKSLQAGFRCHEADNRLAPIVARMVVLQQRQSKLEAYEDKHIAGGVLPEDEKIEAEVTALLKRGKPFRTTELQAQEEQGTDLSNARYLYTQLQNDAFGSEHILTTPSKYIANYQSFPKAIGRQFHPEPLPGSISYRK